MPRAGQATEMVVPAEDMARIVWDVDYGFANFFRHFAKKSIPCNNSSKQRWHTELKPSWAPLLMPLI
jgi:hypothetical protein